MQKAVCHAGFYSAFSWTFEILLAGAGIAQHAGDMHNLQRAEDRP
jgi:hypothetical protein